MGLAFAVGEFLFYLLFSEALSLSTLIEFNSVSVAVPALFFGWALGYGTWEVRNGKEIHWEGRTFYSVPKGLSWQEQYQYRNGQRTRILPENSGEQGATGKVLLLKGLPEHRVPVSAVKSLGSRFLYPGLRSF